MAESTRELRRLLRRVEDDITECRDRIDWYERRVAKLVTRKEEVLAELGEREDGVRTTPGPVRKSRETGGAGDAGGNALANLLSNIDSDTLAKAASALGPLLAGGGSLGGASEPDGGLADDDEESEDEEPATLGGRASPGLDGNIMQLISRVAKNVGSGGLPGLTLGGGGPAGNPLDGIGEILSFAKAGHFKNKSFSLDDATALVNLARSPGVRSLVGLGGQLAAGVAAFNQLRQLTKKEPEKQGKKRRKESGDAALMRPSALALDAEPVVPSGSGRAAAGSLETATEVPEQFRLKLRRHSDSPQVAIPVASRGMRGRES